MSLPVTDEERAQSELTSAAAGLTENVVSTACPHCGTRFAVLARYEALGGWRLRCTLCLWSGQGELKA